MVNKKAQYRIQQMVFMIVALLFFFILVGIFIVGYQFRTAKGNFADLQKEQAISFLEVLRNMPEFAYSSKDSSSKDLCLDLDKIEVISSNISNFSDLLPVASVEIIKGSSKRILCPSNNCNSYLVYDSKQKDTQKYETSVCLCKKLSENSYSYDKCDMGKLIVGVKNA
jgi:hypothetical protein